MCISNMAKCVECTKTDSFFNQKDNFLMGKLSLENFRL